MQHPDQVAPGPRAARMQRDGWLAIGKRWARSIVIGSRGSSTRPRYLGSVGSQAVAQADWTVTVVKTARAGEVQGAT